ncbi:spectrin beta chain, non-erythrocytic 1 isoform X4 [Megalobrama amblycephala]|uniref:spectrin beta chain, non-erythrocytic 1 isoform X4 n=1 Tax=Megalobrama amblycephala TaxID=75352 RepID=UPI002014130B|nr:spectrin beta chain, non-erythrocytic 1 isoform X4 [Megalobrama amblycephala]
MSESIVRKIQPFTIGTKLSAPAVPKCSDLDPDGYLPNRTFSDNCKLRHLNEQVSLYLGRDRRCGPGTIPAKHPREDDHLNRNTVSPNAASRSIRKITISSRMEAAKDRLTPGMELKKIRANSENINNNNNNNITTSNTQLPKIVGVSCENKPNSHLKVLLCKDAEKQCSGDREKLSSSPQTHILKTQMRKDAVDSPSCEHKDMCLASKVSSVQNDHSFTQQNALFNKEITQAEAWIRAKLRDLRDGSNVQKCPLTDWEEVCQTLQRDLKDFENTVIQLNQMGEQLMCKLNPTSDLVKKQLGQIRDQWNTLKQTAANQIKAMGGAKTLQEFNKKVDRLEAWIKEKEQEQSLANILGENTDKMQLTRKILDLKQDEQLYHNLHEEINHMALRLEKQGKTEGKTISTRRKHINKMWLKAQSHLKEYHENLQLALEVSSFYQQADNVVCSINNMRKSLSPSSGVENGRDGEIRDIASQIMMLDVTVSQLSNLHPALAARVTQKQSELKDCWAVLQKTLRNEKAAQLPSTPSLTREGSDPETSSQETPGSVGTDPHRIMGKEVKEEQNRLKGFTGARDDERYGKPSDSQDAGEIPARACARDIIVKLQTATESGNASRPDSIGHPPLHSQLQKFTVSADKTLSWLKDSVAMATQICSLAGPNGFDAAKRRQASLEQDILSNRARIELVKKEGHSLVRAQHPGSIKIQEFLSQLEVLWDELKRRHERNGLVLKVSEELNYRVVRMLQSLASLEAWLEAVELSIRQASLAGDPESVSVAEQESCQLEQELEARRLELQNLRLEVDHLSKQRHLHTQLLPARLKDVEKKFSSVQMALTQQSSQLKDTRMLTEFLEKVELEESHYSTLGQPLCSELDPGPSLLGLPGSGHDEPLMEAIGNPVKELREAVEMLNDTARERGRSQSHDQSVKELLTRHAMVSERVEQCLQRCAELAVDVLEMESEMAVRCEPDRCGLDGLQEYQDQLEAEYGVLKEEVGAMKSLASRLSDVCPERMNAVGTEIQTCLYSWEELGKSVAENKKRLRQFGHLRHFFRNYLAMISWTEDTRSCIFSESALRQSRENQEPLVEVLDRQIEQKFEEFDQLTVAGKKLFGDEHHLNKMIRERMEELRSMLGWILVHWRAQKDQLLSRQKAEEPQTDAIYSEATVCTSQPQVETSTEVSQKRIESPPGDMEDSFQHTYEYEVMKSVSPKGSDDSSHLESPDSPYLVLKEPSPSALGGTVNLILSFSNSGDTQIQVQAPGRESGVPVPEPVHRPAESHSSACKSFWKRCQGLFGSLKRKKTIYRHSAEEDQSMSLLSVHMGLDGTNDSEIQSGRQEWELPSMEGTLERKHKLQLGGKKAPCRAWNSYHAVLYKQTICFYQDRKDTLKSCVTSLPLNLIGAVCEPLPEYTKKPNCFCLRLRDGSEYLLSASSRFMMKKWILRIQAHTASSDSVLNRSTCHGSSASETLLRHSPPITDCQYGDKCHCSMRNYVTTTVLAQSQPASGRTKEIIVHTNDGLQIHQRHQDRLLPSCSDAGRSEDEFESHGESLRQKLSSMSTIQGWTSEKRRSHSFTSATYQRIKPVAPPSGKGQDSSSSYSVTLFIGDREMPSVCKSTAMAEPSGVRQESFSDLPMRSYTSLPRPRNKSVFRKFFGKKE